MHNAPKEILIISANFYPTLSPRSFRATELSKEFAKLGHSVTVLTRKVNSYHLEFEDKYNINIIDIPKMLFEENSAGKEKFLKKAFIKLLIILNLNYYFYFPEILYFFSIKKALLSIKLEKPFDLLISISNPHAIHLGVNEALKKRADLCKMWIADSGDPFNQKLNQKRWHIINYQYADFCKRVDFLTVPIEAAINAYPSSCRSKIKVIPQGFDIKNDRKFLSTYKKNSVPTFAYIGHFYLELRDPRKFLEYLISINMEFKFIIYTRSKKLVLPYMEKSDGRIEIRDYIPRSELLIEISKMDFLVNIKNKSTFQEPSKLIDYYIVKRPILNVDCNDLDYAKINRYLNYNFDEEENHDLALKYDIENIAGLYLGINK